MPPLVAALILAAATPPAPAPPLDRAVAEAPRARLLGLQAGAGFPQGFTVAAVVRPVPWARLHGGVGYNVLGPGIQGGLTLLPWHLRATPSFTFELGRFFSTDVSGRLAGTFPAALDPALRRFGYDFYSPQLGVEMGSPDGLLFFVRGGVAWVRSGLDAVSGARVGGTTVDVASPRLSATVPTANLGVVYHVW